VPTVAPARQAHVLEQSFEPPPAEVLQALDHVRRTGLVEMYDRETVMLFAANLGHAEAAEWMVANRHLYFIALREIGAVR
jgi:hypothetical protein